MTIYSQISGGNIQANVRGLLSQLADVLSQIQLEQSKLSAFADSDLESTGISATDLPFIKSAMADANGLASIAFTGTDPRNPGAGYVYFNSMKQVLGP